MDDKLYQRIAQGVVSLRAASKESGIPETTLRERYHKRKGNPRKRGRAKNVVRHNASLQGDPSDDWVIPSMKQKSLPVPSISPRKAPAQGGKWKRFVVASDIHGDMQDKPTCEALFKFIEHWNPQIRCCLGDVWDFRAMRNGASNEEKSESMNLDFQMGRDWLEQFFGADGDKYLNLGNHDARLYEWAYNRRGVERDFAADKVQLVESEFARLGVKWVPYHKREGIIRLGHLKLLHGFCSGIYAARQTALVYGSCLMGHCHAIDEHHIPGLERRACRIIGACCLLDMDYNARQQNSLRHANGFAYGVLNSITGDYHVFQAEPYDGDWIFPSDVIEL